MKFSLVFLVVPLLLCHPGQLRAARFGPDEPGEAGDLVHRTSPDGLMWGLDGYTEGLTDIFSIHPGHAGIFVGISNDPGRGFEDAVPQVVEAIGRPPNSGVVEINNLTDFCSETSMIFLGAQTVADLTSEQRANIVILACDQLGEGYNENMSGDDQKGPGDNQWICSGLAEKIYESCNKNFGMDLSYYDQYPYQDQDGTVHSYPGYGGWGGVDITPDGRIDTDDNQVSETLEQTKVTTVWPFYLHILFPYTQMIQSSLVDAAPEVPTTRAEFEPAQPNGDNGWYTVDVETTIVGDDGDHGSGIYYLRYSFGDGDWQLYESPFLIRETNYLYSYAKDNAGNYPDTVYPDAYLKIDQEGPRFPTWTNTSDPRPGHYEFFQEIYDDNSGHRVDASYPRVYYSWNQALVVENHNNGSLAMNADGPGRFRAAFTVETANLGDRLFWRCRARDNAGNLAWSEVRAGGVITGGSPYDRIIAEDDPEFNRGSLSGKLWYYYSDGAYKDYYWTYGDNLSGSDCWASWTPTIPVDGYYDIYAGFWAGHDRSSQVPVAIDHREGTDRLVLSQHHDGEDVWVSRLLGTYRLSAGTGQQLELGDSTGEPYDGDTVVLADTVKFIFRQTLESPTPTVLPVSSRTPSPVSSPTPSPSVAAVSTPTPAASPTATLLPSATAAPTLTPPEAAPPTPTATIVRCLTVSGKVLDGESGEGLIGAEVRGYCGDVDTAPVVTDDEGRYRLEFCTHYPARGMVVKARRVGFLPDYREEHYENWEEISGADIPLIPDNLPSGVVDGDYDGNGSAEITLFRPATGMWGIRGRSRFYFGGEGDDLVAADYSGDGTSDVAVFRGGRGLWVVRGLTRVYFGTAGDVPVPGDYGGDGTARIAVYRNRNGMWAVQGLTRWYFGSRHDRPVPGDYDGSGSWAPAVFRPANGLWAVRGVTRTYFGRLGDRPVPGDYTGSGGRSFGIFRPETGLWAIGEMTRIYYGSSVDIPVPGRYDGDRDRPAVFRSGSGLWAVRGWTRTYFGRTTDLPATR